MRQKLPRHLARIAAFTVLTIAGAQVYWRPGSTPVPISLGLLAVLLTGGLLEKREALFTQLAYVLLVVSGLPVYSGFLGGVHILSGMTGGFVIAGPLAAVLVSISVERFGRGFGPSLLAMLLALAAYFGIGFGQLLAVSEMGAKIAFSMAVTPFLLPAAGIALAAAALCWLVGKPPKRRSARPKRPAHAGNPH